MLEECVSDNEVSLLRNTSVTLTFNDRALTLSSMCSLALEVSLDAEERDLYYYGERPFLLASLEAFLNRRVPMIESDDGTIKYLRPIRFQDEDIIISSDKKTMIDRNAAIEHSYRNDFSVYTIYENDEVIAQLPAGGYHRVYLEDEKGNLFEYEYVLQDLTGKTELISPLIEAVPVEGVYRISDLLGEPVSIRVSSHDYNVEYDHVFRGEELEKLLTELWNTALRDDLEEVKGAGGIGFELLIEYEDSYIKALNTPTSFHLGDKTYLYPLGSIENGNNFAEGLYTAVGYHTVTGE